MYLPPAYQQTDIAALHGLIRQQPLGTLVTQADGRLDVNHVPFVLASEAGPFGVLRGHVARANALWRTAADTEAVVIFHGPQGYVSPSWYPNKALSGRVVPTWNYVVVHARGPVRVVDDSDWLRGQIEALTLEHESSRPQPWRVSDAPEDYIAAMVRSIVGLELAITSLTGKWKLSQNRPPEDRQGVIDGLQAEATPPVSLLDAMRSL